MKHSGIKLLILCLLGMLTACVAVPVTTPTEASEGKTVPSSTDTEFAINIIEAQTGETPTTEPSDTSTSEPVPTVNLVPIIDVTNYDRLVETGKIIQEYPQKIYWTDDDQNIIVQSQSQVSLYDSSTLVSLASFYVLEGNTLLDFSPIEKIVAVTGDQQTVEIWDLMSNEKIYSFQAPGMFTNGYFTPDGKLALDSADEIAVFVVDIHSGELLQTYRGFQTAAPVYSSDISKDNSKLLWIARGTIQITDILTDQLGPVFSHEDFVSSYALSPDNTTLVTSAGGTLNDTFQTLLTFWNTTDGAVINRLATTEMASGLDYSVQGDILSGGIGKTVVLWNVTDPIQSVTLEGFTDLVNYTTFSPDGRIFAATSFDNSIRLWQVIP